jgi:dynein heavy chain
MLRHYYEATDQLSRVEQSLLSRKLAELGNALQPGFTTLNWNSLGIPEFVTACNKAINTFQQVKPDMTGGALCCVHMF